MKTTPTPGPYTLGQVRTGDQYINGADGVPFALAMMQDNMEANARLLAAAWEMRALLEYYADGGMNDVAASDDVLALFARIDGRG